MFSSSDERIRARGRRLRFTLEPRVPGTEAPGTQGGRSSVKHVKHRAHRACQAALCLRHTGRTLEGTSSLKWNPPSPSSRSRRSKLCLGVPTQVITGLRSRTWRARDGRSSRASCGLLLSIVRLSLVDRGTRQQTAAFVRLISAGAAVLRSQLHLVSIILATASMTIINTATAPFARAARSLCPDS